MELISALLVTLILLSNYGNAQIADCKMNYMAPTPPGFMYMLYPLPINGVPVFFDGLTPLDMVYRFYFLGQPLYTGTSTNMALQLNLAVPNNTVVQGTVYGNAITVSNFTMNGDGWLKVPVTGEYTFMIESDYAASFYLSNDTASECASDFYGASGYSVFYLGSSVTQPQYQKTTGKVYLYAGIPYRTIFSYIHMSGSLDFAISMIGPDNKYYPDIALLMTQLDPWSNAVVKPTLDYTREMVSSYVPWSGTTTSFISVTSTATTGTDGNLTVTSVFYYATPTTTEVPSSSSMLLTSSAEVSTVSISSVTSSVLPSVTASDITPSSSSSVLSLPTSSSSLNSSSSLVDVTSPETGSIISSVTESGTNSSSASSIIFESSSIETSTGSVSPVITNSLSGIESVTTSEINSIPPTSSELLLQTSSTLGAIVSSSTVATAVQSARIGAMNSGDVSSGVSSLSSVPTTLISITSIRSSSSSTENQISEYSVVSKTFLFSNSSTSASVSSSTASLSAVSSVISSDDNQNGEAGNARMLSSELLVSSKTLSNKQASSGEPSAIPVAYGTNSDILSSKTVSASSAIATGYTNGPATLIGAPPMTITEFKKNGVQAETLPTAITTIVDKDTVILLINTCTTCSSGRTTKTIDLPTNNGNVHAASTGYVNVETTAVQPVLAAGPPVATITLGQANSAALAPEDNAGISVSHIQTAVYLSSTHSIAEVAANGAVLPNINGFMGVLMIFAGILFI